MKSKHHSTKPKRVTKKQERREMDSELSLGGWKSHLSEKVILNLAKDLLLMIKENPKIITLGPWLEKHDLATQTVDGWREKYPEFQYIHTRAKNIMGQRILEKSLYRECDGAMARFCLPNYDKEFKDLEVWRNNLAKEIEKERSYNIYEIPTFIPSGLVPDKENN